MRERWVVNPRPLISQLDVHAPPSATPTTGSAVLIALRVKHTLMPSWRITRPALSLSVHLTFAKRMIKEMPMILGLTRTLAPIS